MLAGRSRLIHVIVIAIVIAVVVITVGSGKLGLGHDSASKPPAADVPLGTPTDREQLAFATAHTLDVDGQEEDALATLQPLSKSLIPATVAESLLATAKIQIELDEISSAIQTLTTLRANYPQSPQADDAQLILGQVRATQGDDSGAIHELTPYAKRHVDLAPYVNLLIAGYLEDSGKWKDALALAQSVASLPVIDQTKIAALEQMRDIQKQNGNYHDYVNTTNQLLDLASDDDYRAELIYERGDAEVTLNDSAAATADLNEVVTKYPDSSYAQQAATAINRIENKTALNSHQIGLLDYDAADYQDAINEFNDALAANPLDDTAWYYRALSTLRAGDDQTATVQLAQLPTKFPNSTFIPQALYTAGRLNEGYGYLQTAQDDYQSVIQRAPTSESATEARLRLGFVLYLAKNYNQSISTLQQVHGDSASNAQASFWLGKSFQQLGQTARAEDAWKNTESLDPDGYYGARAAQLLSPNSVTSGSPPSQVVDTSLSPSQQAALDAWYVTQGTTAAATRATVLQDSGYQRMTRLFALGLSEQANWELSAFADRNSHDLPALAAIGQLLLESAQYNATYRVGLAMENDAAAMNVAIPDALKRLAYPLAYPQLVLTNSGNSKVDPLLFLALVRQESGYDPSVSSSAGARGLAQIVPDTASVLADALGVKNWNADQLFRPYVGVHFGTVYLADRMTKFDGNVEEALAAYNAGDGNAADWAAQAKSNDPDVFVEEIPFTETYAYVQKVYANYLNYIRLYR